MHNVVKQLFYGFDIPPSGKVKQHFVLLPATVFFNNLLTKNAHFVYSKKHYLQTVNCNLHG